jgi:hypothetical protein
MRHLGAIFEERTLCFNLIVIIFSKMYGGWHFKRRRNLRDAITINWVLTLISGCGSWQLRDGAGNADDTKNQSSKGNFVSILIIFLGEFNF